MRRASLQCPFPRRADQAQHSRELFKDAGEIAGVFFLDRRRDDVPCAPLLILGPSVTRRRADGQGPRSARVRARDRAHSAAGQDVLSAEPRPPVAHRRFSAGAAPRVCSLWLLSLAQARESNAPARMAGKTHRDVSRSSRERTEAGKEEKSEHHPHPTLPLKGRAKEKN